MRKLHADSGAFQFGGKVGRLQVAASHADLRRQQMLSAQADIALRCGKFICALSCSPFHGV